MIALLAADKAALAVPEGGLPVVASFARDVGAAGVARLQIRLGAIVRIRALSEVCLRLEFGGRDLTQSFGVFTPTR